MPGKLDITLYGAGAALIKALKIIGYHVLSYALIVIGAYITGHLHILPNHYLDILGGAAATAAILNAAIAGVVQWLNSHSPTDTVSLPTNTDTPPVASPLV